MSRTDPTRRRRRLPALLAVVVATTVLAAPAGAHVQSSEAPVAAGSRTPVTFSFDHGCAGQPTTSLRVQIPAGVRDVVTEDPPGWTSTVTDEEMRWEGGSIPDAQVASFVAVMTIDQPEGTVVRFPTIQGCPGAESAWIQVPDAANPEPEYPAPQIVVGAAPDAALAPEPVGSTTPAPTTAPPTTRVPLQDSPISSTATEQSTAGLVVFLVVMAVIVGGGIILYFRHRRRPG
jgi:uncharacterized protein YcnI